MNKKVFVSMLVLTIIFLVGLYVVKIFFPQEFIFAIENQAFVSIVNYIDNNIWAKILVGTIIGILGDFLYFLAVCNGRKNYKLHLIIVIYNIAYSLFVYLVDFAIVEKYASIITMISTCYLLLIPCLFTKNLLPVAITYCITFIAQTLSLNIRDICILMTNANSITMIFMSFETYLWSILCVLVFNEKIYKKEKKDGSY